MDLNLNPQALRRTAPGGQEAGKSLEPAETELLTSEKPLPRSGLSQQGGGAPSPFVALPS